MREAEIAPVAELFPPQGEWTEKDYFALPDTNRIVELSEGRIIMPPHPTATHQRILQRLFLRLNEFVENHDLGEVLIAPLPVRLWPDKVREPDILFLSREHSNRAGEKVYEVPDLVIEILSPSTEREDRGGKFLEYAKSGVREYWIVGPDEQSIEVYALHGDVYKLSGKYRSGDVIRSELLSGLELSVSEIFRK